MPSKALLAWRSDRMPRLNFVDAQNAALAVAAPPNPQLADENLRGYVMLLSAHFQGFCRDLHTECMQVAASAAPPPMRLSFQTLLGTDRKLDAATARYASIKADFERFGFDLTAALRPDPATAAINDGHVTRINHLNSWRNYVAHHNALPPAHGGPLTLTTVRGWKDSCDGFATALDGAMYNQLLALTGAAPW